MTTETTGRTLLTLLLLLGLAACGDTPDRDQQDRGAAPRHTRSGSQRKEIGDAPLLPAVTALRNGPGWLLRVEPPAAALQEHRIRSVSVVSGDFSEEKKGTSLDGLLLFHLPGTATTCSINLVDQEGRVHRREFSLP